MTGYYPFLYLSEDNENRVYGSGKSHITNFDRWESIVKRELIINTMYEHYALGSCSIEKDNKVIDLI